MQATHIASRAPSLDNAAVASVLDRVASLLGAQQASPFRVQAWQHAAGTVRALERPVDELVRAGEEGTLGGIGPNLRVAIGEIVQTGRLGLLDRLEGELGEDALFATIPGIGPTLARRLVRALDVHTLEALEIALEAGRLDAVPGIGPRRARAIAASLETTLREATRHRATSEHARPSVALLLAIDDEYRVAEHENRLIKIAPRRMNRARAAWLPILHTEKDGWHATALYSNTARAHTLGTTHDWVVIYTQHDGVELQHTIVTETHGSLIGRRVVRGRERECEAFYERARLET